MKTLALLGLAIALLVWLGPRLGSALAPSGDAAPSSEEELRYLIREGGRWVHDLRAQHRPGARPLTEEERVAFGSFFPAAVLEAARVKLLSSFDNPPFYSIFEETGRPIPIDFSRMSAMSLHDTVIAVESRVAESGPRWLGLLFHELVHNTQYLALGDERYYDSYVRGWAESGTYRGIPIERQAYELGARFGAGDSFSVEQEVRRLLGGDSGGAPPAPGQTTGEGEEHER